MVEHVERLLKPILATPPWRLISAARQHRKTSKEWRGRQNDIVAYHEFLKADRPDKPLSNRTWDDLELEGVFARVDKCHSPLGQQILYDLMRRPLADLVALKRRADIIHLFSERSDLRSHIAHAVRPLATPSAYDLFRLTATTLPDRPRWALLVPVASVAAIAAFVLMAISAKAGLLLLLSVIAVNVAVRIYYRPQVQYLLQPISALPNLLASVKRLVAIDLPEIRDEIDSLRRNAETLTRVKSATLHLQLDNGLNPIGEVTAGYANLLFLADVNAFVFSINLIKQSRAELESLIYTVGLLDALSAAAEFRATLPFWCTPELSDPSAHTDVHGVEIYHPVLDHPVSNNIDLNGGSWLITGSNMAGKTTYLRSAGVCAVLSQTLGTCPAKRWKSPILNVQTLIHRKDDLIGGKSYFLVEVEYVNDLLRAANGERVCLFLIDELFRGTNAQERLAAATGVLEHLNKPPHVCLVSTHDLELIDLLGVSWHHWRFEEHVDAAGMHFDYIIRPGAAKAGNALKVLTMAGYPESVIARAYSTFHRLGNGGSEISPESIPSG